MKVRAKVHGFFQGIERQAGAEFDIDPSRATMQGLQSSAIDLLEPIPEGIEQPQPDAARAPRPQVQSVKGKPATA